MDDDAHFDQTIGTDMTPYQRIAAAFMDMGYGSDASPFNTYGAPGGFLPPSQQYSTNLSARSSVPLPQSRPSIPAPVSQSPPAVIQPAAPSPDPTNNPYGFANSPAYMGQGSTGYGNAGALFNLSKLFGGGGANG